MRRRSSIHGTTARSVASIVVGIALLGGAPAVWYVGQPAQTIGDVTIGDIDVVPDTLPATAAPEPRRPTRPGAGPAAEHATAGVTTAGVELTVGERSGPLRYVPRPTGITIPSIAVDAEVVAVGLEADGTMEIPVDVATIGWFEPGVRPGEPGTAVLAGHVDSRTQGRGAFFALRDLAVDDLVVTTGADDAEQQWRVIARTRFAKDQLPIEDLFTRNGGPRLVLITCGGDFDETAGSYTDNIVVYAVPT